MVSVNNLAQLYQAVGRHSEALLLSQRAHEASERTLGPEHPGTMVSVSTLAVLYQAMGRHSEALPLVQRALEGTSSVH